MFNTAHIIIYSWTFNSTEWYVPIKSMNGPSHQEYKEGSKNENENWTGPETIILTLKI